MYYRRLITDGKKCWVGSRELPVKKTQSGIKTMITIYTKNHCDYCTKAKELCDDLDLKYVVKNAGDIDVYDELRLRMKDIKFTTLPQIFWGERHIGGYTDLVSEIENTMVGNYGQGEF